MCVNPIHYLAKAVHNGNVRQPEPKSANQSSDYLDQPIAVEEPWTVEEVGELVEMALTQHTVTSWQSLIDLEILTEAPHELISEYLNTIGKQHLCA